jgi:hypothetical protein
MQRYGSCLVVQGFLLAGLLIVVDAVGRLHSCQEGGRSFGQCPLFPFQSVDDLALALPVALPICRARCSL